MTNKDLIAYATLGATYYFFGLPGVAVMAVVAIIHYQLVKPRY